MDLNVKIKSKTGETVTINAGEESAKQEKTSFTFGKGCDNQKELEDLKKVIDEA